MSVQYPYRAVICGEKHIVKGWRGRNLLTDKGEFIFSLLHGDDSIYSTRLLEVALLQSDESGEWLLNGYNLNMLSFLPAGNRVFGITNDEDLRVYQGEIRAAVWVQANSEPRITQLLDTILDSWKTASQPDKIKENFTRNQQLVVGVGNAVSSFTLFKNWGKPIWLTKFHLVEKNKPILTGLNNVLTLPAKAKVEIVKPKNHKAAKMHPPKPVARFENDFSIAIIPERNGKEIPLTIEAELNNLIKKIIAAGGNVPRTKLRSNKSDTYQPEKLLDSKIAKQLIKAGLLGKNKSGRTTVFWAKQRAG